MLDPQHPQFMRIFISAKVDHLASPGNDPRPICGQSPNRARPWDEYPVGQLNPYPGTHLCARCKVKAMGDD